MEIYKDLGKKCMFSKWFSNKERIISNDLLFEVIVTLTDVCTRKCTFCPRGSKYVQKHAKPYIELSTIEKLCIQLTDQYDGYFSFSGFCEPLTHPKINDILHITSNLCPNAKILLTTNGELLKTLCSLDYIRQLQIEISEYEPMSDETLKQLSAMKNAFYVKDITRNDIKLFNNRAGNAYQMKDAPYDICCNMPFYKTHVDIDGNVILCAADWNRTTVLGNINSNNIYDIWSNSKYCAIRKQLLEKNRYGILCQHCDVKGNITGKECADIWKKIYHL